MHDPDLIAAASGERTMKNSVNAKENAKFYSAVTSALRRASTAARRTARMHGTRVIIWENGRVVAKKP